MCFSKSLAQIQVILISILYVMARMVFFQAHLLKKKKKQIGHNLVPSYKFFVFIAKQIENKRLWRTKTNKQEQGQSCTMPENGREKISHSQNGIIFNRRQKWPFCKGYSKAKWSQMVSTQTEPQNTKNIQKPATV